MSISKRSVLKTIPVLNPITKELAEELMNGVWHLGEEGLLSLMVPDLERIEARHTDVSYEYGLGKNSKGGEIFIHPQQSIGINDNTIDEKKYTKRELLLERGYEGEKWRKVENDQTSGACKLLNESETLFWLEFEEAKKAAEPVRTQLNGFFRTAVTLIASRTAPDIPKNQLKEIYMEMDNFFKSIHVYATEQNPNPDLIQIITLARAAALSDKSLKSMDVRKAGMIPIEGGKDR